MSCLPLFLQTAASGDASAAGASTLATFVPFILIILIMYFLMIRPQSKKQKETQKMLDALKKGDKVITIGGIHGTVSSVKENVVVVKVDDSTKIEFNRTAIASVITDKPEQEVASSEKKSLFGKKNSESDVKAEDKKDE
ncbi:MAG: preprotein translocase subunit YajC [Treponema sp.]|nr:preprotein translocase subunit YajC [Treponema sp.]